MISVVIMAGGKGERFWPKSRKSLPKQFISLTGERTMIQETVDRLKNLVESKNIYISTNSEYLGIILEQLPEIEKENIIIEPMGKNTAACIGLAAKHIERKNPESTMIVLPSDHLIKDVDNYIEILTVASDFANKCDNLVTLGIEPSHPETGYGYINFNKNPLTDSNNMVFKVNKFVEKPNKAKAESYIRRGDFLWNSGMFIWRVDTILKNIEILMPQLHEILNIIMDAYDNEEYDEVLVKEYSKLKSVSIDYGIMEKAENIFVLPCSFGWDDVGSWSALERVLEQDNFGNVKKGKVLNIESNNCIIEGNDKLIATVGVDDLIIVNTDDAILVCSKDKAQDIKQLISEMKDSEYKKYL
jgi:mannose-1-phosphate guanylyltransferase